MMYPRLALLKQFLRPDGSIWITDTGRDRIVRYALPASGGFGVAAYSTGGGEGVASSSAEPAKRVVDHKDGARVERDDGAGVTVPKGALSADLEITVEPALKERTVGEWEGLTRVEIETRYPGWLDEQRRPPDYEDDDEVLARVRGSLETARLTVEAGLNAVTRAADEAMGVDPVEPAPVPASAEAVA